jgi:uncharacterized SAM-binding protein YcdF (DUF218 family)
MTMVHVLRRVWIGFASLSAIVVIGGLVLVANLPSLLMIDAPLHKADHAVVLDGDNMRLLRAKELFDQGMVNDIFVSDGEPFHPNAIDEMVRDLGYVQPDRTTIKIDILEKLGVPSDKIVVFGHGSLTTRDEARALRDKAALGTYLIVTTNYHSRRALTIFRDAMPGAEFQVTCGGGCVAPSQWWRDPAVAAQFILEFVKQLYYRFGSASV